MESYLFFFLSINLLNHELCRDEWWSLSMVWHKAGTNRQSGNLC